MKKVLLYSGGMDSWLISRLWNPDIKLFVNVGTKSCIEEMKRLPKDVIVEDLSFLGKFEQKGENFFLPLRNLFLVEVASYYGDVICLGATGQSTHFDKNSIFAEKTESVVNYLYSENSNKKIQIVMPYLNKTKEQMLTEFVEKGGDLKEAFESSFSCYSPINGKECGVCNSCKRKIKAFEGVGFYVKK